MKKCKLWWGKTLESFYARRQARKLRRKDAEVIAWRIGLQRRRELGDLARGFPAIVLSLCIASISAAGYLRQRSASTAYLGLGQEAQKREDYRAAEVYLQKALQRAGTDRRLVALTLAQSYEQSGDMERAATIMNSLAPTNEVGFAEAHLFMAYQLARQRSAGSEIDMQDWKWHLDHAKERGDGILARAQADYYAAIGDMEASMKATAKAAEKDPELLLRLVSMRASQGDMRTAERELERAKEILKKRYEREPNQQQYVVSYAYALVMGGEFEQALRVAGRAKAAEDLPVYGTFMAETQVLIANALVSKARSEGVDVNASQIAELLLSALSLAPNNGTVIDAISVYGSAESELRQAFRKEVMRRIASGSVDAASFFVMGVFEWIEGRVDKAVRYTKQALDLAPAMSSAANNLAMFMLAKTPADTDRALELINGVLDKEPSNPQYLDTRAQIYEARGEYDAAITDYLQVLRVSRSRTEVQSKLADLYERNGDQELSDALRTAATAELPAEPVSAETDQ